MNFRKIGPVVSAKKTSKDYDFIHVYSPNKYTETQIWPCHEKVKAQPRVIIWTNLVDPESAMQFTKI